MYIYSELLLEMTTQISDKLVDKAIDALIKSNKQLVSEFLIDLYFDFYSF